MVNHTNVNGGPWQVEVIGADSAALGLASRSEIAVAQQVTAYDCRMKTITWKLNLSLSVVLLAGCMCRQPVEPVQTMATDGKVEQPVMDGPLMFHEADLPKGFPRPGPVGEVMIKEYPAYRVARVRSTAVPGGSNGMFRPLFNHIKRSDIAMTAPVEMSYGIADGSELEAMAFLYPDTGTGVTGTDAADTRVEIVDVSAMLVLSVTMRGSYTDARFKKGLNMLEAWLENHPDRVHVAGPPRYLGYNSPFVPSFIRIGEVQLPVLGNGVSEHGLAN